MDSLHSVAGARGKMLSYSPWQGHNYDTCTRVTKVPPALLTIPQTNILGDTIAMKMALLVAYMRSKVNIEK